jgi:hypothetical protein
MVVEKVTYNVNWQAFKRGMSITIPCLNCTNAANEVRVVTDRLGFEVLTKVVLVDNIQCLRVWRL